MFGIKKWRGLFQWSPFPSKQSIKIPRKVGEQIRSIFRCTILDEVSKSLGEFLSKSAKIRSIFRCTIWIENFLLPPFIPSLSQGQTQLGQTGFPLGKRRRKPGLVPGTRPGLSQGQPDHPVYVYVPFSCQREVGGIFVLATFLTLPFRRTQTMT